MPAASLPVPSATPMGIRLISYFLQLLLYSALLWLGFDHAGIELPSPLAAPWLWAMVALAPLVPWHWSCWDGFPTTYGDHGDVDDSGD